MMALNNLHVLLLKKKGVKTSDASGDGTGYSLTISKHYQSIAKELKDAAKENGGSSDGASDGSSNTAADATTTNTTSITSSKKAFVYAFRLIDLDSTRRCT